MRNLIVLLILFTSFSASGTTEVQVESPDEIHGAVILVVDGLGASYVYPEYRAFAMDGTELERALLFNLTGDFARVQDVRVPVPETTLSHSVLVTGCSWADPDLLATSGATIFDLARENGYLCLAILERADFLEMLLLQDGVLFLPDNAIWGAEPTLGARADLDRDLVLLLERWRDIFSLYTMEKGVQGYINYNTWGLNAATAIVEHLKDEPFIMLVNVGASDSAGHYLGSDGYIEVAAALDWPLGLLIEACERNDVLLIVTADHGMSFPSISGKGGHASDQYKDRLESRRVPLVFYGPNIEEMITGGVWSESDIAPTVADILNLSGSLEMADGVPMPIGMYHDLLIRLERPSEAIIYRGKDLVASASGDTRYLFRDLVRGAYTVNAGGETIDLTVNGDQVLDLTKKEQPETLGVTRKLIGALLISLINLTGIGVIVIILKK